MSDDLTDEMENAIEFNRKRFATDRDELEALKAELERHVLADGRNRLVQENSLLRSQFANCHAEIRKLREELLRYTAASDQLAHKVMTPEEYDALNIKGWHGVCRDVDGFGNIGIRYEALT